MRIQDQAIYILHRQPWRDSSLLLDVLSLNHGRFRLVAKGALGNRRGNAAWFQPCQPLIAGWTGRTGMKTLTEYDTPAQTMNLKGERLFCGFYLNELVLTLLPEHETHPDVFDAYVHALTSLQGCASMTQCLRQFELRFLQAIGLAPDFLRQSNGQAVCAADLYALSIDEGFSCWMQSEAVSSPLPTHVFRGQTLLALATLAEGYALETASAADAPESKRLMRMLVNHALNGRELKSRDLFKQLTAPSAGAREV